MKKIGLLLAVGIFSLTACQKDYISNPDNTEPTPNPMRGTFTCFINGDPFEGEIKDVYHNTADGLNTMTFTATEYYPTRRPADYRTITLTIANWEGPKDYQFSSEASGVYKRAYTDQPDQLFNKQVYDEDSKLSITQYDSEAKGTFNAKLVNAINNADTVYITNGEFSIPID